MRKWPAYLSCAVSACLCGSAWAGYSDGVWLNYADETSVIDLAGMGWSASSERNTIRPEPSWAVEDILVPDPALKIQRIEWIGVRDPRFDYDADVIVLGSTLGGDRAVAAPDPDNAMVLSDLAYDAEELLLVNPSTQIYRGSIDFSDDPLDLPGAHFYVGARLVGATDGNGPSDGMSAIAVSAISEFADMFEGLTEAYFIGVSWGFETWAPISELFGMPDDRFELAYRVVFIPEPAAAITMLIGAAALLARRGTGVAARIRN